MAKPIRVEYAACESGKIKAWVMGQITEDDHLYPESCGRTETVLEVYEGHLLAQVRDLVFSTGYRHLPEVWVPRLWPDLSQFPDKCPAPLYPERYPKALEQQEAKSEAYLLGNWDDDQFYGCHK